jgi:hypothetical protein
MPSSVLAIEKKFLNLSIVFSGVSSSGITEIKPSFVYLKSAIFAVTKKMTKFGITQSGCDHSRV